MMIAIVDYGAGNIASIKNMLKKAGHTAVYASDPETLLQADKIILPGVGAFDYGMSRLRESGLEQALNKKAMEEKVPVLGICLGVQLMTNSSEEGTEKGLGWIDGETVKFRFDQQNTSLKVPHMGWNEVTFKKDIPLLEHLHHPRFYFVHSYHLQCHDPADILGVSYHGYDFTCAIHHDNIMGVQFHPEKSHRFGLTLLNNFASNY